MCPPSLCPRPSFNPRSFSPRTGRSDFPVDEARYRGRESSARGETVDRR